MATKKQNRIWNYSINPKSMKPKNIHYMAIDASGENMVLLFRDEKQEFFKLIIPIKELIVKKAIDTKKITQLINKKTKSWQK